jgi:hypothetical protein
LLKTTRISNGRGKDHGESETQTVPKPPGPAPEVLKIEGDWKEAMKKLISKKRPEGGWPKPEQKKRG